MLTLLISGLSVVGTASAQMTVIPSISPIQWVGLMSGPGITISNITYAGAPVAAGRFHSNSTSFGINHGIMLSTGNCSLSVGPNTLPNATDMLGMPGDAALNSLANATTHDAAIIEFDFTPQNDTVRFRYIFASEEYPEFVCSNFNDAFAFFISGPGYPTPVNIARIPGSINPVTINNVNAGVCGSAGTGAPSILTNSNLYVNNTGGIITEMDGYTVPLYAIAAVVPCQTYHLRISIADAGDERYESSVFFEEGSLMSAPVVDAGMNRMLCPGDTASLGGPVAAGWNYQWSPTTGLSNPGSPNPLLTWPVGATSAVQYLVTATNGSCQLRDSVLVNAAPAVTATVTATSGCLGLPVTINAQASLPAGATMSWDFDGGTVLSGTGTGPFMVDYPTAGTYAPAVTFSNLQCPDSTPHNSVVTIHPLPIAAAAADSVCLGLPTSLSNLSSVTSGRIIAHYWQFGDGTVSSLESPDHLFPAAGSHPVVLVETSDFGCLDTFLFQCRIHPLPEARLNASDTAGCAPLQLMLTENSNYNGSFGSAFSWYIDSVLTATSSSMSLELNEVGTYDVSLYVVDANGCTDDTTVKDLLTVHPAPAAGFSTSDPVVSEFDPVVEFSDSSSGATALYWDFGDGQLSNEAKVRYRYTIPGTYYVQQVVTNQFGCSDTAVARVTVTPEQSIWIPSAFTPNGDGRNDQFKAEGRYIDGFRLTIFNRWGQAIFTTDDPAKAWDGSYQGQSCLQDVYDYLVEYRIDKAAYRTTGRVTLLR